MDSGALLAALANRLQVELGHIVQWSAESRRHADELGPKAAHAESIVAAFHRIREQVQAEDMAIWGAARPAFVQLCAVSFGGDSVASGEVAQVAHGARHRIRSAGGRSSRAKHVEGSTSSN